MIDEPFVDYSVAHPWMPPPSLVTYGLADVRVPAVTDDRWISGQAVYVNHTYPPLRYWLSANLPGRQHPLADLEECAIAVDATYYIQLQLDAQPHEPLLPALGGLTGIQGRLEADLDQWQSHQLIPFFIFDGQSITGQDEATALRSRMANEKTNFAWELYFNSQANDAVAAFGQNTSMLPNYLRCCRSLTSE